MKTTQAQNMILGQVYTNEVTDQRILDALASVPRELFVPAALKGAAYVDEDIAIGEGRFLMEPLVLARLVQLAAITEESRVLVIGALNGYAAAIVAKLAQHVVAIEQSETMLEEARKQLAALGITNVDLQQVKSLADGFTPLAPYDAIIVAGAGSIISDNLAMQLALHGKLVAVRNLSINPAGVQGLGKGVLVTRVGAQLEYHEHFDAATALLPGFENKAGFTF